MSNAADENWRVLMSLLPDRWAEGATEMGAIQRHRGNSFPETLLRLFLLHIGCGYSLQETSVRARQSRLAQITNAGLTDRLRHAEHWLRWMCTQLIAENGISMPPHAGSASVRIVDGTIVKEPGKTGSQWRILYSLRLPDLACDFFDLTRAAGTGNGESFTRVPVRDGDLMLGDAAYCSASSISWVVAHRGDVLVRINPQNFPVRAGSGPRFDLLSGLQQLPEAGQIGNWPVVLEGTQISGRVCAIRKSNEAIQAAHRRLERRASKKQTRTKPQTWEYAKYVAVFTTDMNLDANLVLEWYRVRWQIELAFKRLKSLTDLGHVPKHDPQSARAWLYGKLLVALLTQKLVRFGREFSPWGYPGLPAAPAK